MNPIWLELTKKVQEKQLSAASWKSDQKSLQDIFLYADNKGLDPSQVVGTDITKLRTIIKEAKYAIAQDNPDRLNELFMFAATLPVVNLRLEIGTTHPEVLLIQETTFCGHKRYILSLSQEEFERIEKSTRLFFEFMPFSFVSDIEDVELSKELLRLTTAPSTEIA